VGEVGARQNKHSHTREGGYPVIAGANESLKLRGVLDHPPSRMMTSKLRPLFRRFGKPGNDK
jgi:hypothetical protein